MLAIEEQKTNTEHDYVCCTTSSMVFKWQDHLRTTRKPMMATKLLFIKRVRKEAADYVNFSVSSRATIIFKVPYYWQ